MLLEMQFNKKSEEPVFEKKEKMIINFLIYTNKTIIVISIWKLFLMSCDWILFIMSDNSLLIVAAQEALLIPFHLPLVSVPRQMYTGRGKDMT